MSPPAVLLTGVGKRFDIVACFAQLTRTVAADPSPLAPAQYAAHVRTACPLVDDPQYVQALRELCEQHEVGAVLPLTDLDIEVLACAREERRLPAFVPSAEVARATYDKHETHLLLERLGLPSPPTALPWSERIELDLYYVEHRSLALDLRILARTPPLVLGGGGLYKGTAGGWEGEL